MKKNNQYSFIDLEGSPSTDTRTAIERNKDYWHPIKGLIDDLNLSMSPIINLGLYMMKKGGSLNADGRTFKLKENALVKKAKQINKRDMRKKLIKSDRATYSNKIKRAQLGMKFVKYETPQTFNSYIVPKINDNLIDWSSYDFPKYDFSLYTQPKQEYSPLQPEKPKITLGYPTLPIEKVDKKPTSNVDTVFKFFINKGLTPELASGFVGNFIAESGLNTSAVNKAEKKDKLSGYGRGIALWSDSRVTEFKKVMGISPENATLQQQLDFTWYEMQNRPALMNALKSATTPEKAAELAYRGFENGSANALASPLQLQHRYGKAWADRKYKKKYNYAVELNTRVNKALSAYKSYLS